MFRLKFLSALLCAVVVMTQAVESEAIYISRNLKDADLGMLNQQQINEKEADIAFTDTKLIIKDVNIIKSGSDDKNRVNLTLSVSNNSFVEIERGQDAGGWIPLLPEGARAFVTGDVNRGDYELVLAVEGVAPSSLNEYIEVCIPGAVLVNKTEGAVVSRKNYEVPWAVLSSDYKVTTPDDEISDEETEMKDRIEKADEIGENDIDAIKQQLIGITAAKGAPYREIELAADKYISADTLTEIYDSAIEAGRSDRQLSNVCLVFAKTHEDGATDYRLYAPFKYLTEEGNGIDPVIIRDKENEGIKAVSELFSKKAGKDGQVILVSNKDSFGTEAGIITRLDGKTSSNRYKTLYSYDEETKSFSKFDGRYEVDATGYLHFFTDAGGYFVLA